MSSYNDCLAALQYSTNASGSWVTTIVDSAGWLAEIGRHSSIALDSSDKVHISYQYYDWGKTWNTNLKYATNASGSWVTETVDANAFAGYDTSIAVDSLDNVHISYHDDNPGDERLKYTTNASGSWVTETVDSGSGAGDYSSIALDSSDDVHISYGKTDDLHYATNASGSWVTEILDVEGNIYNTAIAVDSSDKVHISYSNADLKYASNDSGSWVIESLDSSGWESSIALDSLGRAHISYIGDGDVKHASNASGSWVIEIVFLSDYHHPLVDTSIALDSSDNIHISFRYEESSQYYNLKYATNATGSWVTITLDSPGAVGLYTSIALDSSEKLHISYYSGNLKYATDASGSWVTETVAWEGGAFTSIAIDSSNKVHISHNDSYDDGTGLKYTTNASGSWVTETVDPSSDVSWETSIALDSSGKVHISYMEEPDGSSGNLRYATNASGSWVIETVDSGGYETGWWSSIAIDSSDKAHISYNGGELFKYATNASGSWLTEPLYDLRRGVTSIALDSSENVHIASWGPRHTTNASGSWVTETVASEAGADTSIAIDSSDKVHISYYRETDSVLKYATNTAGSWVTEVACDRFQGCGLFSSIAVSGRGDLYISHLGEDGTLLLTSRTIEPPSAVPALSTAAALMLAFALAAPGLWALRRGLVLMQSGSGASSDLQTEVPRQFDRLSGGKCAPQRSNRGNQGRE